MKTFGCRKCGSIDLFIKDNGNQVGLYCSDCGTWQKWLNKEERRLAEQWIEGNKNIQINNTNKFNSLEESAKPLIEFLNTHYDPNTIAIVREGRIDIFRSEMGMPLEARD